MVKIPKAARAAAAAAAADKPVQKRIKNKEKYLPKGNKERKRKEREALLSEQGKAEGGKAEKEDGLERLDVKDAEESEAARLKREKKEEKKKVKEARRVARAAALPEGEAPPEAPAPAEPETAKESNERKKKRKVPADADADADISAPTTVAPTPVDSSGTPQEERPKKKRKKDRTIDLSATAPTTATVTVSGSTSTTLASTPVPTDPSSISLYLSQNRIHLSSPTPSPLLTFSQLPVHPTLLEHLLSLKFSQPTPIQACAWPALLEGRDVIGIAETGSGKTLAFGVPALQSLVSNTPAGKPSKSKPSIKVLVVAPTRELALQTHDTLSSLSAPFKLLSVPLYGGVPKPPQLQALAQPGAAVVVGTPGRVLDFARTGELDLSGVGYLVLDEADRMLDRGFEPDIREIVGLTKREGRQTAMFSATWPESVRRLAASFQRDPFRITVGAEDLSANKRVAQSVEVLSSSYDKDARLRSLLQSLNHSRQGGKKAEQERTLIFVLYKKEATRVEQSLSRMGYHVAAIHGDMGQQARIAALDEFKQGRVKLLVATDVAARGLDIPAVGTVLNYSFPLTIEDYIHRIGRTGRGGASGKSITFFTGEAHEKALAGELMRVLRDAGCEVPAEMSKFPNTIRKKEHSVYGAFYRDDIPMDAKPKKITFD
ncbi:DEAD-domain-containing protein [Dacryopinax primogenitus]|uniref:RNA helicase n=1 Tax=Dacryopinax primogenitus (strain DJM 731) TaxID=1858805 RepID=M5FUD4_DACPD|nr:DEAD-domain-containing protein [Dacryopinax primogenitus]EJT99089.1 DEAD-domain-containing protein [Dacryopinax primogenitus]